MTTQSLNVVRFLSFELGPDCDMGYIHRTKCPNQHPERYKFGNTDNELTDEIIVEFWKWCRFSKEFRGIIHWNYYNEPTLYLDRCYRLMTILKQLDKGQPFRLLTNKEPTEEMLDKFDLVRFTDYTKEDRMDNRLTTIRGSGKPYYQVDDVGWCTRGYGWEMPIDFHGNWNLCCSDFRCEESMGNIFIDDWDTLLKKYIEKVQSLRWKDESSYNAMPRLCRACIDTNFYLHRSGGS